MGLSGLYKNRAFPGFIPKRPTSDSVSFVPVASSTQVLPVDYGIPCIGFVVYPTHRRLKARKVINATRHLNEQMDAWRRGDISFAELDASVKGWINHVRYADSWDLRKHVFKALAQR